MHDGKIVEEGTADQVCEHPMDPYTKTLLAAVPIPDPRESRARARPASARRASVAVGDPSARTADQAAAGADPQRAAGGRGVGLRAEARRLPRDRLRRRRGRPTSSRAAAKRSSRYFPELSFAPGRYVLDGELVIRDADGNLEFDALQSRIHPAESRIKLLSKEIPAGYIVFDLLAEGDEALLERAAARAPRAAGGARRAGSGLELTTLTADTEQAEEWLRTAPRGRWRSSSTPPTSPASARGWRR